MEKAAQTECTRILKQLMKTPDSEPFRLPVDVVGLQLYDYTDIVKCPMDLGQVESRLKNRKYTSDDEFFSDIQLIWNNCKRYNQEGSYIYQQAITMEKMTNAFKQNLLLYKSNNNTTSTNLNNPPNAANISHTNHSSNVNSTSNHNATNKSSLLKEKFNASSLFRKKPTKTKESGNNSGSIYGTASTSQPAVGNTQTKKERTLASSKGNNGGSDAATDKYANPQERKYAHISLRLNLAFRLKNASEDKLINLFSLLSEKYPQLLSTVEDREHPFSINITLLPDQVIQDMLVSLGVKE